MARGDSIIRVSIIGDAKQLQGTLTQVDTKLSTIGKTAGLLGGAFLGSRAVSEVFDIGQDALRRADDFNDAIANITGNVSPEFAQRVKDVAFDFTEWGLSADEFAGMASSFGAIATSAGVAAPLISEITPDMVKLAAALAAQTGRTPDEVIEAIAKAIKGNTRPVEEFGIVIDKTLSPDETVLSIMDQLTEKIPDTKAAFDDLAGAQNTLEAKWDNLLVKIGGGLEGPLKDLITWTSDFADGLGRGGRAVEALIPKINQLSPAAFPGLGNLIDMLAKIPDLLGEASRAIPGSGSGFINERDIQRALDRELDRNGLRNTQGSP